jgi:peptide/nickel transport system permease protein
MFAINGMGYVMFGSLKTADFDVVMLLNLFYVALALFGNLLIDIIYGLVDPRVRVNK